MIRFTSWNLVVCAVAALVLASGCVTRPALKGSQAPAQQGALSTEPATKIAYPQSAVKVIVPRSAGGSTDTMFRLLQPYLKEQLGVPVVVENVTGAGGIIGNEQVYKAKPDGYTLLFTGSLTDILKQVSDGTPYDFRKYTPVYNIGGGDTNVLVVRSESDIKSFADLVARAKSKKLTVGKLSGVNVASIALALMINHAGIPSDNLVSVPFNGGNEPVTAVAGGHVDLTITQPSNVKAMVDSGKVRVLAVFSKDRDPQFPDAPTFAEAYPGEGRSYEIYQSLVAPPGTPAEVVHVLNQALDKATKDPKFVEAANKVFSLRPISAAQLADEINLMYKQAERLKPTLRN